ncbi:hypothetical protein AB6A40_010411 [Gnathostoma spinigerum]|uniref:Uncharacterized protein n=1 Tax=Gnathostoma spinigerum TaxID=75299 RepID=A0ABD6F2E5_9BILA
MRKFRTTLIHGGYFHIILEITPKVLVFWYYNRAIAEIRNEYPLTDIRQIGYWSNSLDDVRLTAVFRESHRGLFPIIDDGFMLSWTDREGEK